MLKKIISGGQTGVDQAALEAAIKCGIEHGGWCPPGRVCENGVIPIRFDLRETPQERDPSAIEIPRSQRTIWNVRDSNASLIIKDGDVDPGTQLAIKTAIRLNKPYLIIDMNSGVTPFEVKRWILENKIEILSIGGSSENSSPGIFKKCIPFLSALFKY